MSSQTRFFPPMPEIGHSEAYYKELVALAEKSHSAHAREAAKVGQYVALGLDDRHLPAEKVKYFTHALRKHCKAPGISDDMVEGFYERLSNFVRTHAGREALRLASMEDDRFALRVKDGEHIEKVKVEAKQFFEKVMGPSPDERLPIYTDEDWQQLRLIRLQWI